MAAVTVYEFAPGAVAANTPTTLPSDAPVFQRLTSVLVQTEASGGTASTTSPAQATVEQTIPTGGLAAGEFALAGVNGNGVQQWQYGSATTDGTVLTLIGFAQGHLGRVS